MTAHLYVAPAGAGKTRYAIDRVRQAAASLAHAPVVIVPSQLLMRSWQRRLASAGGALGVRVVTFQGLYNLVLDHLRLPYTQLSDPAQHFYLGDLVQRQALRHYARLVDKPGFVQSLQGLVGELQAARIEPDDLADAARAMDGVGLEELASVYGAYRRDLARVHAADRQGLGMMAVEALSSDPASCCLDLVVVDGFDSLTPVQLEVLCSLAHGTADLLILLAGDMAPGARSMPYQRVRMTQSRIEQALGVEAEPLPSAAQPGAPVLSHLVEHLFGQDAEAIPCGETVALIEAPNREAEVREALRWLKARIVMDDADPSEVALLARDLAPYLPYVPPVSLEFGVPVQIIGGMPLLASPVVSALLDLLRLALPVEGTVEPNLDRRLVIEAWRCPYFDLSGVCGLQDADESTTGGALADALDQVARWGRVIGGLDQWRDALTRLRELSSSDDDQGADASRPADLPVGSVAEGLGRMFEAFVARITPAASASYREHVRWLEDLIGDDERAGDEGDGEGDGDIDSLCVLDRVLDADASTAALDLEALRALKEVLRGLLWAREAMGSTASVPFATFAQELFGAVEAAVYSSPHQAQVPSVTVADVVQARGVPYRAVAILGNAEGEFPARAVEDPLLPDSERLRLEDKHGLPLERTSTAAEPGFFLEAVARPWHKLLLTRPRLDENGAEWLPSTFWQQVRRVIDIEPTRPATGGAPELAEVASEVELVEAMASTRAARLGHVPAAAGERYLRALVASQAVVERIGGAQSKQPPDAGLCAAMAQRFGPDHTWSASRIEAYRSCPYLFFVASALRLEPRQEPAEGLDARQLGDVYHEILALLYQTAADTTDLEALRSALPRVAGPILDQAPAKEGFRETAWWRQTRKEILEHIDRSLVALDGLSAGFRPYAFEQRFGGHTPLIMTDGSDTLRLHGFIDRVDVGPGGIRIIDYKTSGPAMYTNKSLEDGTKLQIGLYALAARDALRLGEPVEGFYWHVRHAEPSKLTLSGYGEGAADALDQTAEWAWRLVREVRAANIAPAPQGGTCPSYCPAAGFCWHYRPGFGG